MNKISVQNYSGLTPSHVKSFLILKNAKFLASYFIQVYKKYLDFRIEASEWHSAINQNPHRERNFSPRWCSF